jgi:CheY-like chemotaxis protein
VPLFDLRTLLSRRSAPPEPRTILIVDDGADRRRTVRSVEQLGYRALQATTTEAAAELLESEDPACVLLALDLAGGRGLEALGELRADQPDLCVVMLARDWHDARTADAMRLGAVAYLAKPFSQDDLREVLARR